MIIYIQEVEKEVAYVMDNTPLPEYLVSEIIGYIKHDIQSCTDSIFYKYNLKVEEGEYINELNDRSGN